MEQKKTNQERTRKGARQGNENDQNQPSRAPRQDEDGRDLVGSHRSPTDNADGTSEKQGISNRPANEEHAFPGNRRPDDTEDETGTAGDDHAPRQQGGNRGGV